MVFCSKIRRSRVYQTVNFLMIQSYEAGTTSQWLSPLLRRSGVAGQGKSLLSRWEKKNRWRLGSNRRLCDNSNCLPVRPAMKLEIHPGRVVSVEESSRRGKETCDAAGGWSATDEGVSEWHVVSTTYVYTW
jgi:hypothetical protein